MSLLIFSNLIKNLQLMPIKSYLLILLGFSMLSCQKDVNTVTNIDEFNLAFERSVPGTVITMDNGIWKDVELVFEAEGIKSNNGHYNSENITYLEE